MKTPNWLKSLGAWLSFALLIIIVVCAIPIFIAEPLFRKRMGRRAKVREAQLRENRRRWNEENERRVRPLRAEQAQKLAKLFPEILEFKTREQCSDFLEGGCTFVYVSEGLLLRMVRALRPDALTIRANPCSETHNAHFCYGSDIVVEADVYDWRPFKAIPHSERQRRDRGEVAPNTIRIMSFDWSKVTS